MTSAETSSETKRGDLCAIKDGLDGFRAYAYPQDRQTRCRMKGANQNNRPTNKNSKIEASAVDWQRKLPFELKEIPGSYCEDQ